MSNTEMQKASNGPVALEAGHTATEGFGTTSLTKAAETASTAVAAQARATIEARYVMALRNPRDLDTVRLKLLKECLRPGFAQVARYLKPVGQGITGPSIRFAETAIRCMTNISVESQAIFDSPEKRVLRITVTDLEGNTPYSLDITIEKTVERSKVAEGQTPISTRLNSNGKITYLVPATEDDLLNKQNAQVSKAIRTLALRLVPGDIVEEAMAQIIETQRNHDAQDPDAARKKLMDAFAGIGVQPGDLKAYLGHDTGVITPAELADLRAVFAAIRDGEANWRDTYDLKMKSRAANGNGEKAVDPLKERVKAKTAKKAEAAPVVETPAPSGVVVDEDGVISDANEDA